MASQQQIRASITEQIVAALEAGGVPPWRRPWRVGPNSGSPANVISRKTYREVGMTTIGEMTLEEAATQAAGNWRRFNSFVWFQDEKIAEPEDWAIIYTHNRDSRLLDLSNAQAVARAIGPFTEGDDPDVVMESHDHWAIGHVDGFSIRVYRNGGITDAFKTYHDFAERLADYPILDEEDYGRREYEATLENIADAAWRVKDEYDLHEGWEYEAFSWFDEHRQRAIENRDDQGGYPEENDLRDAFEALGYERVE